MIYKLRFKLCSPLTNIPNSQSIFGTFCHLYKFKNGEEKLESFLDKLNKDKDLFFSSMFYEDTLPKPMNLILPRLDNYSINDAKNLKKEKKIECISEKLFIEFRKNKEEFLNNLRNRIGNDVVINSLNCLCEKDHPLNNVRKSSDMRVRNNSMDEKLFYNYVDYYSDGIIFNVYIKYQDIKGIDETFKSAKFMSIGSNKSIGYNSFEYIDCKECPELDILEHNMLISIALCNENIDYSNSYYKVTVERSKFNNNAETVFRDSKVCLKEGSIINTKELIGDIVKEKDNNGNNYQYLLGFLI